MNIKLPRILSPNLGCPIIVSLQDRMQDGVDVEIAEPVDDPGGGYRICWCRLVTTIIDGNPALEKC